MSDPYYVDMKVGTIRDLKSIIGLDAYWRDVRLEYSDGNLIYRAANYFHDALTTDTNWEIWKYTWDISENLTRIEGPLPGSWDDRAALNWGT